MQITIQLLAQLKDASGQEQITLSLAGDSCPAFELLDALFQEHPNLSDWQDRIAVARQDRYIKMTDIINDGDTIALIPPVSGG